MSRIPLALLAFGLLLGCGGEAVQLARSPIIDYEAREKFDDVAPGGFDENLLFGRYELAKVGECRDRFEAAVNEWAAAQNLQPELIDPTKLTATIHVPTLKPIEYFEFVYSVDPNAHRARITVSIVDPKGQVLEPKMYEASYRLKSLAAKLRGVLQCAR